MRISGRFKSGNNAVAKPHALVLTRGPYVFATRPKKAAQKFSKALPTTYLSLARVGRTSPGDKSGTWLADGVRVIQLPVRTAKSAPTAINQAYNVIVVYLPALLRLMRKAARTPATVVFVNGPSLIMVGILHKLIFKSKLVLDINERPGMVTSRGSVASLFARVEIKLLRATARYFEAACVVTQADTEIAKGLGFKSVHLVRNVPVRSWVAPWTPPPLTAGKSEGLKALMMGSIFEGRGYEALIEAVAIANRTQRVDLELCGPSRQEYLAELRKLAEAEGVAERVRFSPRIDSSQVSAAYLKSDVGLVLYEGDDPGNDGLSNKLFECVCSGRPVIASDLPENRNFVSSNGVGWLTRTTPEAIAEALLAAAVPERLTGVAEHCREFSTKVLSWENEFAPIMELTEFQTAAP